MNVLRLSGIVLGCCVLVALTTSAVLAADEKAVDKDKIVGTWKLIKEGGRPAKEKAVLQFAKDGKVKITSTVEIAKVEAGGKKTKTKTKVESKTETMEGTYKVEGDKLTVVMVVKFAGKERKETMTLTIKTLTDKKLTVVHDGKEDEFEKTK